MNWWGKPWSFFTLLFFLSCANNESSVIGLSRKGENLLKIEYKEFEVPSGVFISDSLQTGYDNVLKSGSRLMVGRYVDPHFGVTRATCYSQFSPYSFSVTLANDAALVSAVLVLGFDYYRYGTKEPSTNNLTVYELENPLSGAKYTSFSTVMTKGQPIGSASYTVDPSNFDTKLGNLNGSPSTLARKDTDSVLVNLDASFAAKLFDAVKTQGTTYKDFTSFSAAFPGIALIPSDGDNQIVGFDMAYSSLSTVAKSRIILTYNETDGNGNKVEKKIEYGFYNVNGLLRGFTHFDTDRTGTSLQEVTRSYLEFRPPGVRCYQSGSPMLIIADFNDFVAKTDALENLIFNSVELSIDIEDDENFPPPKAIQLKLLDPSNQFINVAGNLGINYILDYPSLFSSDERGFVSVGYRQATAENTPSTLRLLYDKTKKNYHGDFTALFQNIRYTTSKKELRPKRFALVAQDPWAGLSVNRFVFKPNNLKLKVYYTTPSSTKTP